MKFSGFTSFLEKPHMPEHSLTDVDFPIAYHITFGTYGARLHGDERGTVDRRMNEPGDPIIGQNDQWREMERRLLVCDPVWFSIEQMREAERVTPCICQRGGWALHAVAAAPNHVHVLLSAKVDGEAIRKWLKRWLGEALDKRWQRPASDSWWSKSGSVKWVWKSDYFDAAYAYVEAQKAMRD